MERIIEGHDTLAPGGGASDLDRVLHRLGPGVDEEGALWGVAGSVSVELVGEADVGFIAEDAEGGVGEHIHLPMSRGHDPGVGTTHVHDADAPREIDELSTLGIDDDGLFGPRDE